ncbi:S-type pyocin domain-containing protein [Enterobacteriaceae bacterium YMB-R22]|jgi:hypothetical protein|nr:S-type pyocin domain-containing protein [Tenebrionicola larvae]
MSFSLPGQTARRTHSEEEARITIIWTSDSAGITVSSNTGNQNPVRIPNPVVVDPLAEDTSIETTTTPAPEVKNLDGWLAHYNNERTYQGKMCCGRTPMETLLDRKHIWAEENLSLM